MKKVFNQLIAYISSKVVSKLTDYPFVYLPVTLFSFQGVGYEKGVSETYIKQTKFLFSEPRQTRVVNEKTHRHQQQTGFLTRYRFISFDSI